MKKSKKNFEEKIEDRRSNQRSKKNLKVLTDEEVKYFVAKNFNETIRREKNLRKAAKPLNIFLATADKVESNFSGNSAHHCNVEILNLFYPELQMNNTKPVIENNLNEWLSELKKFKVQTTLVYKKKNDLKGH